MSALVKPWEETWRVRIGRVVRDDGPITVDAISGDEPSRAARARLAAAAPDMARVLLALQWDSDSRCPVCHVRQYLGDHAAGCAVLAALRKAGVVP